MAPYIGAVGADVEGDIAEQQHPPLPGQLTDVLPLTVEMPLHQPLLEQLISMVCRPRAQRPRVMTGQRFRPGPPGGLLLPVKHGEEDMVLKPALVSAPCGEQTLSLGVLLRPVLQQGVAKGVTALIRQLEIQWTNPLSRSVGPRQGRLGIVGDEALLAEIRRIQEPGVQGEAGRGAVRGSGGIGRSQRQHLPDTDAVVGQLPHPATARLTEASADRTSRQG